MPETEHVLREAPYLVTDARRRGWGMRCSCGWRSPLLNTSEEALADGQRHLLQPNAEEPDVGKRGLFGWMRRRPRPQWEERRRD